MIVVCNVQVADKELNCLRCHEGGALLAVGDDCGKTYVIEMNDWFVTPGKNDKALLTAVSFCGIMHFVIMVYYVVSAFPDNRCSTARRDGRK
jgi:hypothetical protein